MPYVRLDFSGPLHVQLREGLRRIIVEGRPKAGTILPSSRTLAAALGISRNTVMAAYEELTTQDLLEGRTGSGTRVCARTTASLRDPDGNRLDLY